MRVLIVGAGIAGIGAALYARREGFEVDLVDASATPGGLLAPVDFLGLACDRGSHRAHADAHPALFELTADADWQPVPRRGVLVLGGRHVPYPLSATSFARALGLRGSAAMALGWLARPPQLRRFRAWERDRGAAAPDEGFEAFVLARVGEVAYQRFYAPYVEKVWGLPPRELSRSVARQRVSTSSPLAALLGALRGRVSQASFLYPRAGLAPVVDALMKRALAAGVRVTFRRPATREDIARAPHDRVIFTAPLRALAPEARLEHRGLYLLHFAFPSGTLAATDTWYAPEARYWFGRVSQPARFASALAAEGREVLAVEVPEGRWGPAVDFLARRDELVAQLVDAAILPRGAPVLDARQTWVPDVYPLYRRGWIDRWTAAMADVRGLERVLPAGRQGLFLHCNMDHALAIARDAVTHLARGADAAAWIDGCARYLDLRVRD